VPVSRFKHALIVGKFAPLHRGHQRLAEHALEVADELTIVLWSNPDFEAMPNETRAGWLAELYPTARVIVAEDGPANTEVDLVHRQYVKHLLAQRNLAPDVVVSAESYGPGFAAHLGVEHVALDRTSDPVWQGDTIRMDVHEHRRHLDPRIYSHFIERVVFLGAESTGKSTLTARMAEEFSTRSVLEYHR
jgi:HTH-type transcriptional regulator, transcriptional repressor of NAD biosynthesis genes